MANGNGNGAHERRDDERKHEVLLGNVKDLRGWLESPQVMDQLTKAASQSIKPDRLVRVAITAFFRTPKLLECPRDTILRALLEAAALGLEPTGVIGHAYLVPYRNKDLGIVECQLQVGYKGLITLAMRHPDVQLVDATAVREGDEFRYRKGMRPDLEHVPNAEAIDPDPAKITHVYAIAWIRGAPHPLFEVMSRAQVEAIRKRSKANGHSPWVSDYEPMSLKTVTRRLINWHLPMETEAMAAIAKDDAVEYGEGPTELAAFVPLAGLPAPAPQTPLEQMTRTDQVGQRLKERVGALGGAESTAS